MPPTLVYYRNFIVAISDEGVWDRLEDANGHKWVLLHAILRGSFVFRTVDGLLAKVQADWEDRRCFLPSKPLARTLFLLNDDVSTRNVVQTSPSSFRAFPASFG